MFGSGLILAIFGVGEGWIPIEVSHQVSLPG